MNKAELIEFRRKLVLAKELCKESNWFYVFVSLEKYGLHWDNDFEIKNVPPGFEFTPASTAALFNDSIAHVDKLIAEAK